MKLFLSYSSDDKAWVHELGRQLRDRAHHDAWWDYKVLPANDWWETILTHLEASECIVYILTPRSVESIYCQAEIAYAVALNKPILPLILKECDYPALLKRKRIQHHTIGVHESMGDVLFEIERALGEIRLDLRTTDRYKQPEVPPGRPDEPKPVKSVDTFEVLARAEALAATDFSKAEALFQEVIAADPDIMGVVAEERLAKLRFERDRDRAYRNVKQVIQTPGINASALTAWNAFSKKYPNHDPDKIAPKPIDPVKAAIARAWDFKGAKNRDWTPFVTTFPDWPIPEMAFCLVPVGSFMMGSDTDYDDEKPAHRQTIQRPYWIAQTPVTNRQWRAAVKAGWVSDPPDKDSWNNDIGQWYRDPVMADCPVVGISWFAALEFCQAIACHLPNERDWEYAARGVESWIYPWGDDWEGGDKAVWRGNSGGKPNPVTDKPEGASWVGALHLSGNVWEWCSTLYDDFSYPYQEDDERDNLSIIDKRRVLRGGSWYSYADFLRAAIRSGDEPSLQNNNLGFRCARFLDS